MLRICVPLKRVVKPSYFSLRVDFSGNVLVVKLFRKEALLIGRVGLLATLEESRRNLLNLL
jgi:hypothetical protein